MHGFIPISDETGITLAGTYNAQSAAERQIPYRWRLYYHVPADASILRQAPHLTERDLSDKLLSNALNYIADHPVSPIAVGFHNTLRLFELGGARAWHASARAVSLDRQTAEIGVLSYYVVCLLALAGAATVAIRAAPRWLWGIPVLFAASVVLVNAETPRFRVPIEPFLILSAACAVTALARRFRGRLVGTDRGAAVAAGDAKPVQTADRVERIA
jgi:hypothetical protein